MSVSRPATLVAAAALVDDVRAPARLLAARRSAPPHLAGCWELPGGKVEKGEDPQVAVHREVSEELGITIRLGDQLRGPAGGDWPILDGLHMRVWLAVIAEGSPALLTDHDELRWVGRGDWRQLPWLAPDIPILEAVLIS